MKYIVITKTYGRFKRRDVKAVSNRKAEELESEGKKVFDTKSQANAYKRSLR